jgi:hypothetical protein
MADLMTDAMKSAPKSMPEDSSSDVDAAKDVLAAIKSNDAKALSLALKRCYEAHAESSEEDEEAEM